MKKFSKEKLPTKLKTRWADSISRDLPWPEYPRPQMTRPEWHNLNGLWDYAITGMDQQQPEEYEGQILVPFPIESSLSGVEKPLLPDQCLWYRRQFEITAEWQGQRICLHFGAVDWHCQVWCNGNFVGEHSGGYVPFSFDITDFLDKGGENELLVAVDDPTDEGLHERGKQTLRPRGIFYTAVSGIWQTVWIEPVPQVYIEGIKLTPAIDPPSLQVEVTLSKSLPEGRVEVTCIEDGKTLAQAEGPCGQTLAFDVPDAELWSPENPHLYDLQVRVATGGVVLDQVGSYCGFREVSLQTDDQGIMRIFLNNDPYFQYGPLDQGYWPDGLYTAPTDEALIFDIEYCKSLGLNMIRKHVKVEQARWYYHCDQLGMLVWQDMPNGGKLPGNFTGIFLGYLLGINLRDGKGQYARTAREDAEKRALFKTELESMLKYLHNHPSIIVWVPFNEAWGQFDAAEIGDWVKTLDPSRLVDAASGWYDQKSGDIHSIHKYVGPAMPRLEDGRAIALSEFGGVGLDVEGHVWMDKTFCYREVATREALLKGYLSQIEKLIAMKHKGLSAAIYTEICDVEREINGYLTYDRQVQKLDREVLREVHQRLLSAE